MEIMSDLSIVKGDNDTAAGDMDLPAWEAEEYRKRRAARQRRMTVDRGSDSTRWVY